MLTCKHFALVVVYVWKSVDVGLGCLEGIREVAAVDSLLGQVQEEGLGRDMGYGLVVIFNYCNYPCVFGR